MTGQDPGQQAAQDQIDTAYAHAVSAGLLGAITISPLAIGTFIPDASRLDSVSARKILDQYMVYAISDGAMTCEHNPLENGPVAIWCPGIDAIMCPQCALPAVQAAGKTPWETTCDLCGTILPPGTIMSQESLTIEGRTDGGVTIYPSQLLYSFCLDCPEAQDSAPTVP
jgi:hypothetical protein